MKKLLLGIAMSIGMISNAFAYYGYDYGSRTETRNPVTICYPTANGGQICYTM